MLYSHDQLYPYSCRNITTTSMSERRHFFRKIYLSLYWKGCVWQVSWRLNKDCNILTPQLFWLSLPFFPILQGCSSGGPRAHPLLWHGSHFSTFSPTALNFLSPGLYNNLSSTYFLQASHFTLHSTRRQSRLSPDIFDRMHLLFTQVHFSSDSPAESEVNMQQKNKKLYLTVNK